MKVLSRLVVAFITVIFVLTISYLFGAWCALDFDPHYWPYEVRFAAVFLAGLFSAIVYETS